MLKKIWKTLGTHSLFFIAICYAANTYMVFDLIDKGERQVNIIVGCISLIDEQKAVIKQLELKTQ